MSFLYSGNNNQKNNSFHYNEVVVENIDNFDRFNVDFQ